MSSTCIWHRLGGGCVEDSRSRQSGRRLPLSLSKVLNSGWVMTSHALDKTPRLWFTESTPVYVFHLERRKNVKHFAGRNTWTEWDEIIKRKHRIEREREREYLIWWHHTAILTMKCFVVFCGLIWFDERWWMGLHSSDVDSSRFTSQCKCIAF